MFAKEQVISDYFFITRPNPLYECHPKEYPQPWLWTAVLYSEYKLG